MWIEQSVDNRQAESSNLSTATTFGPLAELADAPGSKSDAARRESSNLSGPTKFGEDGRIG